MAAKAYSLLRMWMQYKCIPCKTASQTVALSEGPTFKTKVPHASRIERLRLDLPAFKVVDDSIEVEFNFCATAVAAPASGRSTSDDILAGLNHVQREMQSTQDRINELDQQIDRLTNRADHIDNWVAVGSSMWRD